MPSNRDQEEAQDDLRLLLVQARRGDQKALGRVLQACRNYLLLVADQELDGDLRARISPSDLVQETFARALPAFGHFQGKSQGELLAWLRTILKNHLINVSRQFCGTDKRRLDREVALDDIGEEPELDSSSPSEKAARHEEDEVLDRALNRLPEHLRQVVLWRNRERLSFEEIGKRLDRSAAAARKLWVRALRKLDRDLESADESG